MSPVKNLPDDQMQRKFQECNLEQKIQGCTAKRLNRDSYHNPIRKRREYTVVYTDEQGQTVAIVCHYTDPDGQERSSIRLFVDDDTTYIQDGVVPSPHEAKTGN